LCEVFLDELGAAASDFDGHVAGSDDRAGGGDEASPVESITTVSVPARSS
jgi:hypothetical protein